MAVRMAGQPSSTTRSRCWSVRIACLAATPWPPFCAVGDPMIETGSGMYVIQSAGPISWGLISPPGCQIRAVYLRGSFLGEAIW